MANDQPTTIVNPTRGGAHEARLILSSRSVLEDVSAVLAKDPEHAYGTRGVDEIDSFFVHHTGGSTAPRGRRAVLREAEFFVRKDDPLGPGLQGRGWPGFAYTFFLPHEPDCDAEGRLIAYRTQPDAVVSYHTGDLFHPGDENRRGVAVACQGHFTSRFDDAHAGQPSAAQMALLEDLWAWAQKRYAKLGPLGIYTHSMFGKPACPGARLEQWVMEQRRGAPRPLGTWKARQEFLELEGFKPGAVDGIPGHFTKAAIVRFQAHENLAESGHWDMATERRAMELLAARGGIAS